MSAIINISQSQLSEQFPEALSTIEEVCKVVDGLQFYFDFEDLYCAPLPEQVAALGNWEAHFINAEKRWEILPLVIM